MSKGCCTPSRPASPTDMAAPVFDAHSGDDFRTNSVEIPGGAALSGTDQPCIEMDGEGPLRQRRLKPFRLGKTCVTNRSFAQFVAATDYQTEAERFGWSFVFWSQLPDDMITEGIPGLEWWRKVDGACWRDPRGCGEDAARDAPDFPVVHMSWNDARTYAAWVGGRLPREGVHGLCRRRNAGRQASVPWHGWRVSAPHWCRFCG